MRARIYRSSSSDFECKLLDGSEKMIHAKSTGNLLKDEAGLVVGDYVSINWQDEKYLIVEREKRSNEVFRILVREKKRKVTAANIDLLVIVMSVSKPAFKRGILDRYLVRSHQWDIPAVVVFNKVDEYDDNLKKELDLSFEASRYHELGIDVFEISALRSDYQNQVLSLNIEDLRQRLFSKTALFVGQSGVGKSQAIQSLSSGEVDLPTNSIGVSGKGSHTTTWSQIIDLGDFLLMDSPGIRSFSIDDIDPDELIIYFPDLAEIAGHCQFFDCRHEQSSKGCAFWTPENAQDAVIHSRLESYRKLRQEVGMTPHWKKKH